MAKKPNAPPESASPPKRRSRLGRTFFLLALVLLVASGALYVRPMPFTGDPSLLAKAPGLRIEKLGRDLAFYPAQPTPATSPATSAPAASSSAADPDTAASSPAASPDPAAPIPAYSAPARRASLGFILYTGAKVPQEAYAWLAREIALAGYPAFILKSPLNFAILDSKGASRIVDAHPDISAWVLAGHSLGGVAAAMYAKANPLTTAGIVFLASYPAGSTDLSASTLPVSLISASNDMLATAEKIDKARHLLPPGTSYLEIQGGNHAGFGDYGPQKGDGASEIPHMSQKTAIFREVIDFMKSL